ncbi:unnamed protein product [Enterobius vermicularis]|uniref:OTU domain-containing protein n=1 Tax=Enterobius vermicularis TaxID=51028 RepID=A0A158QBB5_ENTVE|nr:unnamed protein product [Enterobius vermicularis]
MEDTAESDELTVSPYEQLKAKHRKEKKDLLAKITSMKHSVPKNDKKRRKEVGATAEKMEKSLKDRQEKELSEMLATMKAATENIEPLPANGEESKEQAQETKEKKAEMRKRLNEAAEEDAEASKFAPGRTLESEAIINELSLRNLRLHEIPANGDCLYNALAHQLSCGKDIRRKAASYIRAHKEDFLPFLTWEDGTPVEEIEFEKYCWQVENMCEEGGQWGGEPELKALSSVLERRIEVLQPEGRVAVFGDEFVTTKPLVITYHRYAYSLGEHYNSTEPAA